MFSAFSFCYRITRIRAPANCNSHVGTPWQYQNTPIVFITAKVQADEVDQLLSLGANAVISKPFEPMDMAQKLKDIWEDFHRA